MTQTRTMVTFSCFVATMLAAAALAGYLIDGNRGPSFDNLQQACSLVRTAGFFCVSDRADGTVDNSFIVSREPMTWEDAGHIRMSGPMGPRWKGCVWIIRSMPFTDLWTTPGDTEPRVWGKLWAFGDDDLLNEIERCNLK